MTTIRQKGFQAKIISLKRWGEKPSIDQWSGGLRGTFKSGSPTGKTYGKTENNWLSIGRAVMSLNESTLAMLEVIH